MKKVKKMNRKLLNLPSSSRRKGFKLSDPANAFRNPLQTPSTTAFLNVSRAKTFSTSLFTSSYYVNAKLSRNLLCPTFVVKNSQHGMHTKCLLNSRLHCVIVKYK